MEEILHQLIGGKHPIIFRVSTIQGEAGFLPSTVCINYPRLTSTVAMAHPSPPSRRKQRGKKRKKKRSWSAFLRAGPALERFRWNVADRKFQSWRVYRTWNGKTWKMFTISSNKRCFDMVRLFMYIFKVYREIFVCCVWVPEGEGPWRRFQRSRGNFAIFDVFGLGFDVGWSVCWQISPSQAAGYPPLLLVLRVLSSPF